MKRLFSFVLAVMIGWGSVTQPARAFAPPLIYAAYMTASTGAGTYAIAALAGAIGVTGLYLTIKDAQDNAVRIPVGPNEQNKPPEPVAAPTATATPKTQWCYTVPSGGNGSGSPAGTYCGDAPGAACPGYWNQYNNTCYDNYWGPLSTSTPTTTTCPSGYTSSGGSCVLSNARQAKDDKTCDMLINMGQFATADDMNCGSTVDGSKLAPMIRNGKAVAYGTNSSGQPLMWEVTPGAQSYTITQYEQIQTPTQTQIKTTTATVDTATSSVTSVQTSTAPGSMSAPSASTAPTVTTEADPATTTNTPTVTQDQTKPADTQTCGLPGSPACNVNDDGFEGKDTFIGPKSQEISDKLDQNKTQLENSKDSLPNIAATWLPSLMPGNATACVPLLFDFSVNNHVLGSLSAPNVKLDICDQLDLVRSILGYMLGVFTVWYVWRRFVTANQGA